MSFSGNVKEELSKHIGEMEHCQMAELSAIMGFCGQLLRSDEGKLIFRISSENQDVIRKYFTLLKKTFNIETSLLEKRYEESLKQGLHIVDLEESQELMELFQGVRIIDDGVMHEVRGRVSSIIIEQTCCKRTFLRGAFLGSGSMSDPEKSYHLEIVCANSAQADQIKELMQEFELFAKIIQRKKYYVVYLKEGAHIVDFLNVCEAHISLMEFENLRIVKEMRNSINRRVNCEAANITKTVNASAKQVTDILLIKDLYGFENLTDHLREMAEVRLENPDATLQELGDYLNPPVGKSGVNHRLRKLSEIADSIRN